MICFIRAFWKDKQASKSYKLWLFQFIMLL